MNNAILHMLLDISIDSCAESNKKTVSEYFRRLIKKKPAKKSLILSINVEKRAIPKELMKELAYFWKSSKTRSNIDIKLSLLLTLWYLANKNPIREISDRFGIATGSAHKIIFTVCKIIIKLMPKYVRWPQEHEMIRVSQKFNELRGGNGNVVGVIDGTHIKIPTPKKDPASYFNRKSYYSLILQVVCDSNLKFTDAFFGWPGSSHDAHVWQQSPLRQSLEEGRLQIPDNMHLLGDSAYPLRRFLLVPYKDNGFLTKQQKEYNFKHSSIRVCVEQAIGLLKNRFEILDSIYFKKTSNVKYVVMACIILHNYIIINSNNSNNDQHFEIDESLSFTDDNEAFEDINESGKEKRDLICSSL